MEYQNVFVIGMKNVGVTKYLNFASLYDVEGVMDRE